MSVKSCLMAGLVESRRIDLEPTADLHRRQPPLLEPALHRPGRNSKATCGLAWPDRLSHDMKCRVCRLNLSSRDAANCVSRGPRSCSTHIASNVDRTDAISEGASPCGTVRKCRICHCGDELAT